MAELKQLGKYKIEELIGSGAYADVFRAVDHLNRKVALKVLKPYLLEDVETRNRFVQEAQAAAGLFHPQIATVLDLDENQGFTFLAMRFVDGKSLAQVLRERGFLPWEEALKITEQIGAALDFAHAQGFVHRDVKPGNILLGDKEGAVLTDFGLVKAMENSGMNTQTGMTPGTLPYIAPEIWKGEPASPASDQYALACVLFEMLTGKVLFEGPTPFVLIRKHTQEPPSLPQQWPDGVPDGIGLVLQKSLHKSVGERYAFISEMLVDLSKKKPVDPLVFFSEKALGYFEKGKLLLDEKKPEEAVRAFTRAIELNALEADFYLFRGKAYNKLRRFDFSIKDFSKGIELVPQRSTLLL